MRTIGTQARGIRAPIIKSGDLLDKIVVDAVVGSSKIEGYELNDRDIVGVTEAVVARAQGNYATVEQIACDVKRKTGGKDVGVVFPILSRNRFSVLLKGIAQGVEHVIVQLSYPSDEVGNKLISLDLLDESSVNPYSDSFTEEGFNNIFGNTHHEFTGVDYVEFYKSLGDNISIVFSNDPRYILNYTKNVIACDVHTRARTKQTLKTAGAELVIGLDSILSEPCEGSGYNPQYGLLGSNKATEESVKLFPRDCSEFVANVAAGLKQATGKNIEVLIYGDGAFKDPVGGIWELADPVVSPAYTAGLAGTPNELKLKYLADNQYGALTGKELEDALKDEIRRKDKNLVGNMAAEGTTPRKITDLLGSLCDLVSGSGDKGTPIILIQGYFDNFAV